MNKQEVESFILSQQSEGVPNSRIARVIIQEAWVGSVSPEVAELETRKLGYPMSSRSRHRTHSHLAHTYLYQSLQKAIPEGGYGNGI